MNRKFLLILLVSVIPLWGLAQPVVRGTVTSSEGEALSGVTVIVENTTTGTVSNARGHYQLKASTGDTLIFSLLGYESVRMPVSGTEMNVVLTPDTQQVEEVVVVGYGIQRKVDVTGSVSTVKGQELLKAPVPNLTNALTGKMTGVITKQQSGKPGLDDPTFIIRGKSTFGDNGTLTLVDGVERSIGKLDPNEIESITILKDAASAAIYGVRGANGVVLVTTKRGSEGRTRINYSGTVGFQQPTVVPEMMNAYEYAKYLNLAMSNVSSNSIPRFTGAEIEAYRTGKLPSTNWWKETFRERALMHQHNLTLDGGNDRVRFFISGGMLDQNGLYDQSDFRRYNIRSNIDTKVTRDLSISVDLAGRFEKIGEAAAGDYIFTTVINSKPTERPYVPDSVEPGGLGSNGLNLSPIGQAEQGGYHRVENSVFNGTLSATYEFPFVKGLKIRGRFSYDRWFSNDKTFTTPYDFYTYDRDIDLYTRRTSGGGIDLYEGTAEDQRITVQAMLTYDRKFGNGHTISALALYEGSSYKYRNLQASRVNYISGAIDQIYAGPTKDLSNGGSANETAMMGYALRVNYNYKERYLLQANVRTDGSFNFPKHKRWGVFPAVSVGWRLSEEPFLKDRIHNLKLRASYGEFGNDRVAAFQYMTGFVMSSGSVINGDYQSGISDKGIANPNITWEKARNFDVGLDFGLFDGALSGELTWFCKKTRDILLPRSASVPESFGATLPDENIGKVDNRGWEAVLRYARQFGDFRMMLEGNLTYARSKVVFMDEAANIPEWQRRTGLPLDQFFGYKAVGLFQSQEEIDAWAVQDGNGNASLRPGDIKYEDYDDNGVIDGQDKQRIGRSQIPELIYGLNFSFSWKGLDLTMNWQGAGRFDQFLMWDPFNLESNALRMYMDSWHEGNRDARYPRLYAGTLQNNRETSSFWLYNGRYLRLRNLEISYTFSRLGFLRKAGIRGLRIFVSGNNLLTFSKIKHLDPEAPNIHPDNGSFYYPQMKTYNVGVNIEF